MPEDDPLAEIAGDALDTGIRLAKVALVMMPFLLGLGVFVGYLIWGGD